MAGKIVLSIGLSFFSVGLFQGQTVKDTFRIRLDKIRADTTKVNEIVLYAKSILYSDPSKAWNYCREAISLSKRAHYTLGLANAYRLAGAYNNDIVGDFTKADAYFSRALNIYKSNRSYSFKEGKGAVLHSYGALYQRTGNYLKAVEYYIEGIRVLDSIGNKTILPRTYNNLASLYSFMMLFDKSEYYARLGLLKAKENNDTHIISILCITLSDALIQQKKYENVLPLLVTADSISKHRNDHYAQLLSNYNYSNYYAYYKKDYVTSLRHALKAYSQSHELMNPFELARTSLNLAEHYDFNNNTGEAINHAGEALAYAKKIQSTDLVQRSYYVLGAALLKKGEYRTASEYLDTAAFLKDSVILEGNRIQINFLEASYQKEKKEKEIIQLQNEKQISSLLLRRRNVIIITLIAIILLLGLVAFVINRNIHQKRVLTEKELELQKQKLTEIERQRQLDATLSVLQGEEAERSRLARDLHDGLGGLLSGVKLSLTHMKGNIVLKSESVEQFDKALGLLDTSIRELRRVAHNMMPEALVKFGTPDAISDFCSNIENTKGISVKFQLFGQNKRIDSKIEISIYRIAQELINNAIKHASATEILVQLIMEDNRVHLTVQDNGKGFDTNLLKASKGAGMANIRSRVESQNGNLEIYSEPDKGTEISVEFNWDNKSSN